MAASHGAAVLTVRPAILPVSWALRLAWCVFVVYFAYALSHLELTPARFLVGLEHGQKFLSKLFPPDFQRWELLVKGLKESLEIAILASVLGILISLPVCSPNACRSAPAAPASSATSTA